MPGTSSAKTRFALLRGHDDRKSADASYRAMPLRHRLKTPRQNALLRVQAIFGLVEHHRLRAVDHLVGDFVAAMGGKAMHEQRVGLRQRHQLGIDLIWLEQIVEMLAVLSAQRETA